MSHHGHHLRFDITGNSTIWSANPPPPKNPTLAPNTKLIGQLVPEMRPFEILQTMASSHVWFAATGNKPDWKSSIPENCTLEWNTRSIRTPDPEISSFEDSKMAEIWQSCDTKLWWIWKICPEKCWRCLGVHYHISPSALWLCMHIGGNRLRDWPYSQLSDLHDLGLGHMAQRHVAFVNLYLHKFCSNQETFGGHTDVRTLTPASLRRLRGVDLNMQHVASILLRTGHQTSIHFLERTGATEGRWKKHVSWISK